MTTLNINMTKVDEKVVDASLRKFGLKEGGLLNAKVSRLQKHQRETTPKKSLSEPCSICGGESDLNLSACPFCGDAEIDATAKARIEETKAPTEAAPPEAAAAVEAPAVKPKPSPRKRSQVSAPPPAATNGAALAPPADEAAAPVVLSDGEKLLDDAIGKVREAQQSAVDSYWDVGQRLQHIFEHALWKHRLGADGKPVYRGWNQFVSDTFTFTPTYSYVMMQVSQAVSREVFREVGMAKLQLLLRLPDDRREQLIEEARAGKLPVARVREIIAEEKPERRATRPASGGQARGGFAAGNAGRAGTGQANTATKAKAKAVPSPDGEVTAVSALGRVKVKLFTAATFEKPAKEQKRATTLAQLPCGAEELINGVVTHYRLVKEPSGSLTLVVERRRMTKDEDRRGK